MTPAQLMIGWERFQQALSNEKEEAIRVVRQSQHFITPDGIRFAPVRLLGELAQGLPFPNPENDSTNHKTISASLCGSGWSLLTCEQEPFEEVFQAWVHYCQKLSPEKPILKWRGSDPKSDRTFLIFKS